MEYRFSILSDWLSRDTCSPTWQNTFTVFSELFMYYLSEIISEGENRWYGHCTGTRALCTISGTWVRYSCCCCYRVELYYLNAVLWSFFKVGTDVEFVVVVVDCRT